MLGVNSVHTDSQTSPTINGRFNINGSSAPSKRLVYLL